MLAVVAGVTGLGLLAPKASHQHASTISLAFALGGLGAAALCPYVLPRGTRIAGGGIAVSAGLALAWSGLSTKFVADALHQGRAAAVLGWAAATGLASGIGLLSEMTALQRAPATRVAPVVFAVQVVVPVGLAPLLTGEHWTHGPLAAAGIAAALVVVVGGAVSLLRSGAVLAAVPTSEETETGASPLRRSPDASAASSAAARGSGPEIVTTTMSPAAKPRGG